MKFRNRKNSKPAKLKSVPGAYFHPVSAARMQVLRHLEMQLSPAEGDDAETAEEKANAALKGMADLIAEVVCDRKGNPFDDLKNGDDVLNKMTEDQMYAIMFEMGSRVGMGKLLRESVETSG